MSHPSLRLAVAGCGKVFQRYHLPALRRTSAWAVVAACDAAAERRAWARTALPAVPVFASLEELLAAGPPDAVLIATPPSSHAPLAVQALLAGSAVLVEKPMALDTDEARRLCEVAGRQGAIVRIGFNRRFRATYLSMRRELHRRAATAPRDLRFELVADTRAWLAPDRPPSIVRPGEGVLDDVLSHQLDLLPWLTGRRIAAVRARPGPAVPGRCAYVRVEARLDGEGPRASCTAGHDRRYREWLEARLPHRTVVAHAGGLLSTRLSGRRSAASLLRGRARLQTLWHRLSRAATGRPNLTARSFQEQLVSFANAVRGGRTHGAGADAAAGLACVLAVEACRRSLEAGGRWEELEELPGEGGG